MRSSRPAPSVSLARLAHMQQQLDALRDDIEHTVSRDVRAVLEESVGLHVAAMRTLGSAIDRWS